MIAAALKQQLTVTSQFKGDWRAEGTVETVRGRGRELSNLMEKRGWNYGESRFLGVTEMALSKQKKCSKIKT